jgi:hypothetical protein
MPLPPYPALPNPRTWGSSGPEPTLVPELRGDVANAATLFLNPPMVVLSENTGATVVTGTETLVGMGNEIADPWQMHQSNFPGVYPSIFGWYLVESAMPTAYVTNATGIQVAGVAGVQSGSGLTYYDGGKVSMMTGFSAFPSAAKLMHITQSLDYFAGSTYQSTGGNANLTVTSSKYPMLHAQWVCASSGTTGLPVPSNPTWPVPPAYVTSAFLNANIRDTIRFLTYPPITEVASGSNQGIASASVIPTVGTQLTNLSAVNVDNYSAWGSNQWTAPVAGLYFMYAQVNWYEGGITTGIARAAGLTVTSANYNGGTQVTLWGNCEAPNTGSNAAQNLGHCSVVRRYVRVNQGDTVQVAAFSNDSGGTRNAGNGGNGACRFIAVWRAS